MGNKNSILKNNSILKREYDRKPRDVEFRPLVPISDYIEQRAIKLLGHITRREDNDPLRKVTYHQQSVNPKVHHKKRVGHPRTHWTMYYIDKSCKKLVRDRCPYLMHVDTPRSILEVPYAHPQFHQFYQSAASAHYF